MSTPNKLDPTREPASQTDENLLRQHAPAPGASGGPSIHSVLLLVFSFLLAFGALYLEHNSAGYSVKGYDEDARAGAASSGPKPVDMVAYGKKQYLSQCVTCHQPTGLGLPGTYPPLAGSEWANGSEDRLVRIVLHGLTGPLTVSGVTYSGTVQMPSFGQVPGSGYNWRDDQIAAVLTYVRQEWGNKAAPVTPAKVTEIRSKQVRDKPWTVQELLEETK